MGQIQINLVDESDVTVKGAKNRMSPKAKKETKRKELYIAVLALVLIVFGVVYYLKNGLPDYTQSEDYIPASVPAVSSEELGSDIFNNLSSESVLVPDTSLELSNPLEGVYTNPFE